MNRTADAVARAPRLLPTGNVAFLFTDIVGSTVKWERNPQAMRHDVERHDALMRVSIGRQNGYVFKTIGDAFCAAFWSVDDAARAAVDAHRALATEPFAIEDGLSVRIAIHLGEAHERDADYFGPTVNRVARLLSIGHGGQVLLSASAAESFDTAQHPSAELRDLGKHRLKDLSAPEHVFQIVVPDLCAEFPPLSSLTLYDNNLPHQTSSFIGREEVVGQIKSLLHQSRLVTLSGAGGVGKTRCALQVGVELLEESPDGVWFADLAPLGDGSLVAGTIGRIFQLQGAPDQSPVDGLAAHLKSKKMLLILDNCEHVIADAAKAVSVLLRHCPHVRILATSREALNVAGETLHRMPSLDVPKSVALFEERARNVKPGFSVTTENAAAVTAVCRRLDGIPLAIELAAARTKILTPRQLLQKLDERFRILTGGDRAGLPRQQTMRALIDWSYDLLSEREQTIFRTISVFVKGFTIEQAMELCESPTLDAIDVLDVITSLVDKSLVVAEPWEDSTRYRFLESTHEYAREKLEEWSERERVTERHARVFADFLEDLDRQCETLAPPAWFVRGEAEIENLRAALSWSFTRGDRLVGQRITVALPRIFGVVAPAEGLAWVNAAFEHVTEETPGAVVAGLELARATLASVFNYYQLAYKAAERALKLFEKLGLPNGVADAQRLAGRSLVYIGAAAEGEALLQEALRSRTACGSTRIGGILGDLAVARALQGDVAGARTLFARASDAFQETADASKVTITAATLAEAEFVAGNAEDALRLAEEALTGARNLERYHMVAAILGNVAAYELSLRRYADARQHALEALDICCDGPGNEVSLVFALQHLAAVAARGSNNDGTPNIERAANLLGYVDGRLEVREMTREHTEQLGYLELLNVLERTFDADRLAALMGAGKAWSEERAIAQARAI